MAKEKSTSGSLPGKGTKSKQSTTRKTASQSGLTVVAAPASATSPRQWAEPSATELDQEIRQRAYEYFCERGGQHGGHEDDWHRAEQEVREKYREKYNYGT
jgi:hypothetical protein